MHSSGAARGKYQRFKVAIPVNIGLIVPNREETLWVQFWEVATDISKEGFGLELSYPASRFPLP